MSRHAIGGYDPWDPAVMDDPYPSYRWLRDEHRYYFNAEREIYVLSRQP